MRLKILLSLVFAGFTALSFYTLNKEIVVEQKSIGMVTQGPGLQGKELGFAVVAN